jgi:type III secretory pathway lipoprotein EscJ
MHLLEDDADPGRHEIVASPAAAAWTSSARWRGWPLAAAVAIAVAGAGAWWAWSASAAPPWSALAVPADRAAQVRSIVERAGIAVQSRDGALWVPSADARRALDAIAAASDGNSNAVAQALASESVFSSGETARGRRTAATITFLETTIGMQPGVERVGVVLGEPARAAAPGMASSASATVTVAMRQGSMGQDLVDAVAMMVAGACPGLAPERVVVVDANEGRLRRMRDAEARQAADAARESERRIAAVVSALIPDLPGASVSVACTERGAAVVTVGVPSDVVELRASAEASGDAPAWMEALRTDLASRIEPFLPGSHDPACAGAVAVVVADPAPAERIAEWVPEPALGAASAVGPVARMPDPEQSMPLGSAEARSSAWGTWVAMGVVFALAGWWWVRLRARGSHGSAAPAELGKAVDAFEDDVAVGAEASAAVRETPAQAAGVLRSWIDSGRADRAALAVVVLDAPAATLALQALPPTHVQRVTEALSVLDAPTPDRLAEAERLLLAELELGDMHAGAGMPEAA